MRPVRLGAWVWVTVGLAACGGSAPAQSTTAANPSTVRRHPRHRAVTQAFDQAASRAGGCLPREVTAATVDGAFIGATGEFHVTTVTTVPESSTGVRRCVREEFENARVEPFADERFEGSRSFGPEGHELASAPPDPASSAPPPPVVSSPAPVPSPALVAPPPDVPVAPPVASPPPVHPRPVVATIHEPRRPAYPVFEPPAVQSGPLASTAVDGCYRSTLRIDPTVGGRMRLRYDITSDGVARNVRSDVLGGAVGHMPLTHTMRCIEQRARAQAYPRSASGTVDLLITLTPPAVAHRPAGAFTIETANAGLLSAAPGMGPLGSDVALPPPAPDASVAPSGVAASPVELQAMSAVLQARVNEIRGCYQQALTRDGALQLRVRVHATVDPSGRVADASSTTVVTGGDPDLAGDVGNCVETLVRGTAFAGHSGTDAHVATLPFLFAPEGRAPGGAAGAGANAPTVPAPLTGHVDATRTSQAIRARVADVQQCYSSALGASPTLAGRVTVQFTVDPGGRVVSPSSQTTVSSGDPEAMQSVARCIEQVLASTMLPPPIGGAASVALPFDFGATP